MTATPATVKGNWGVIVEFYSDGRGDNKEIIRDAGSTKEQALEVLRALVHTYLPRPRIVEKRRQVYRFTDRESYVVLIKGKVTQWHCTLRVAELVSDSTDPSRDQLGG